jgi:hypothetical protein
MICLSIIWDFFLKLSSFDNIKKVRDPV